MTESGVTHGRHPSGVSDECDERFSRCRWSLRFQNQSVEEAFKRGRKPKMFRNLSVSLIAIAVIVLPNFSYAVHQTATDAWEEHSAMDIGNLCSLGALVSLGPLLAGLMWVRRVQERLGFCCLEVVVVLLTISIGLRGMWFIHASGFSIERSALGLDALVTAVHLILPIRWYVSLWMDIAFALGFAAWCTLATSSGAGAGNLYAASVFAGLVLAASLGLRSMELGDRKLFATAVDDRTRNARAEIDLEQSVASSYVYMTSRSIDGVPSTKTDVEGVNTFGSQAAPCSCFAPRQDSRQALPSTLEEGWLIKQDELEVSHTQILGRGCTGLVVEGTFRSTPVAVKLFASQADAPPGEAVLGELRTLRRLSHPNIVLFYGACLYMSPLDRRVDIRLVFEKVKGKTLKSFVTGLHGEQRTQLDDRKIALCLVVMKDVTRALIYLHGRNPPIVHAGLKPTNIMVSNDVRKPSVKLLDFGTSRAVSRSSKIPGGTSGYRAPEVQTGASIRTSTAVDMFALGRLLMYQAYGQNPGKKAGKAAAFTVVPEQWRSVIEACTRFNPRERPTAVEVYHQLFQDASMRLEELVEDQEKDDLTIAPFPPAGRGGADISASARPSLHELPLKLHGMPLHGITEGSESRELSCRSLGGLDPEREQPSQEAEQEDKLMVCTSVDTRETPDTSATCGSEWEDLGGSAETQGSVSL
mmetsp:Transcript_42896/g.127127  ORF Transcript_42896/g.127127 Transcript_42896/m.127127 type:complete len:698 (+) Transcript_42896:35-2128(+)